MRLALPRARRIRLGMLLGAVAVVLVSLTLLRGADEEPAYEVPFAGGDSAANVPLDDAGHWVMLRHVAGRDGDLARLYVHVKVEGSAACPLKGRSGYAAGTTGRWLVTTHPVAADGTPELERELAREEVVPCDDHQQESLGIDQRLTVREGQELATVFRNIDPRPTRNWASLNFLYRREGVLGANGRNERSAEAADSHYGLDPRETVGYSTDGGRSWAVPGGPYGATDGTTSFLPTYIHEYSDGEHEGQAYYTSAALSGPVRMVYPDLGGGARISAIGAYASGPGEGEVRLLVDGRERASVHLEGAGVLRKEIDPLDVAEGATVSLETIAGPGGLDLSAQYGDAVWAGLAGHGKGHSHYLDEIPERAAPVYPLRAR